MNDPEMTEPQRRKVAAVRKAIECMGGIVHCVTIDEVTGLPLVKYDGPGRRQLAVALYQLDPTYELVRES